MDQQLSEAVPTSTVVETVDAPDEQQPGTSQPAPVLRLRLEKPNTERHVGFHQGVVDNEHLNRKKSKCCCIYRKPLAFGESSSEDDEDCEHCFGHPELRRRNRKNHSNDGHTHSEHDGIGCPLLNNDTTSIIQSPSTEKITASNEPPKQSPPIDLSQPDSRPPE